jgi:two-component system response regulator AtoC
MPGLDGPAFIGGLVEEGIAARVVVITGYATLEAAVDCLRKGAVDFLIKPFEVEDFLASVEKALERPLPRAERACDWDAVGRRFGLTRRQKEVLQAFYATGQSCSELAEDLCLSPHTVKSHLKVAYQKLGVSTRGQLVRVVQEAGS